MADIRINDLPLAGGITPAVPTDNIAIDGSITRRTTIEDLGNVAVPVATQATAEAGVNSTERMTPLTTKQSIASEVGVSVAPFSLVDTVSGKQNSSFKLWNDADTRTVTDRFKDTVSVMEANILSLGDLGAAVNFAISKCQPGQTLIVPPLPSGASWVQTTGISISKPLKVEFGRSLITVVGAITALTLGTLSAYGEVSGGQWTGDRTTNQRWASIQGFRSGVRDSRVDLFDEGFKIESNPYSPYVKNVILRNIKTKVGWVRDSVGAILDTVRHDVDGVWYGGSYPAPVVGIHLQSEGNIVFNCDMIHSGIGTLIEADHRDVYWNFFLSSYLSDSSAASVGVELRNNSVYRLAGNFFQQCWSATNKMGFLVSGTTTIDGAFWNAGTVHNNLNEGVRIENTLAKNIIFEGVAIMGNNSSGAGANAVFTNVSGRVGFRNCQIGRGMGWTSQCYDLVFSQSSQSGEVDLSGSWLDPGGFTNKAIEKFGSGDIVITGITGLRNKNKGVASFSGGLSFCAVPHGLSFPIQAKHVMICATGSFGANSKIRTGEFESPTIGEFQIIADTAPGAGIQYAWWAEIDRI